MRRPGSRYPRWGNAKAIHRWGRIPRGWPCRCSPSRLTTRHLDPPQFATPRRCRHRQLGRCAQSDRPPRCIRPHRRRRLRPEHRPSGAQGCVDTAPEPRYWVAKACHATQTPVQIRRRLPIGVHRTQPRGVRDEVAGRAGAVAGEGGVLLRADRPDVAGRGSGHRLGRSAGLAPFGHTHGLTPEIDRQVGWLLPAFQSRAASVQFGLLDAAPARSPTPLRSSALERAPSRGAYGPL
jgi:hypothetical protein